MFNAKFESRLSLPINEEAAGGCCGAVFKTEGRKKLQGQLRYQEGTHPGWTSLKLGERRQHPPGRKGDRQKNQRGRRYSVELVSPVLTYREDIATLRNWSDSYAKSRSLYQPLLRDTHSPERRGSYASGALELHQYHRQQERPFL